MSHTQREIIQALGVDPNLNITDEIERRVRFLAEYAKAIPGVRGFVLGISGGQDSTLAGRLCQLAAEQLRRDGYESVFVAMRLPYGTQHDEDDAQLALSFIRPDHTVTVNVKSSVDALVEEVNQATQASELPGPVSDFNKGNVKARARMVAQYALAGDMGLLVVGSDHAAEAVTGFYTKFGDGAADVMPLAGLTKSQGALMLQELDANARLWQKVPTADLLDGEPGQTDESSLGLTYAQIDAYLSGDSIAAAARDNLEKKYARSMHKRQLPVTPADTWWKSQA